MRKMDKLFSTADVSPHEGFARWAEDLMRSGGWPFPADPVKGQPFHAEVWGTLAGDTPIVAQRAGAYRVRYGRREINAIQDRPRALMLLCHAGELRVESGSQRFVGRAGDVLLLDLAHPVSCDSPSAHDKIGVLLDRAWLGAPEGMNLTQCWRPGEGLTDLIRSYVGTLTRLEPAGRAQHGGLLSRHMHTLVGAACMPAALPSAASSLAAARLAWIEQWLDRHFMEPRLSAEQAARAAGISVRYLHRLFEDAATSFSQALLTRRLQAARHALADPFDRRTVTAIAHDCGFSDAAHFSRAFRAAFGCTPSEFRGHNLLS
jgi:AraC-like DNA-binding protein